MRAKFVPYIVLLLILAAASAGAAPETVVGLPVHMQKLDGGTLRVWVGDHVSSTATLAVATSKGLVIIDTTGNPEVDRELRKIIAREFGRDDFKMLINTHEHGDHTGGNAVYADCTIVGHELVAEGMSRNAANAGRAIEWGTTRVAELEGQIAQLAVDATDAAQLKEDLILNRLALKSAQAGLPGVPPTKTFADRMTLDFGDTTFELYYIGGMHTASDIAVFVPEQGLLLTGDTMADVWLTDTPGCLASFIARPGIRHDFPLLLENWNILLAKGTDIKQLLTGHWNGELTFAGFEARVKYIEALWAGANETAAAGGNLTQMLGDYRLDTRFPELAQSPGCSQGNNGTTILEMWSVASGQTSGAQVLYELIDEGADEAAIRQVIVQRDAESPSHFFLEYEINALGYRFVQAEKFPQAVAMFRINMEFFPDSWNVYDSLGEALVQVGDKETAIAMYEKSLELNPESPTGRQMLELIRSGV